METDAICNDTENNRHSRRVADRLGATIDLNLQNRLLPQNAISALTFTLTVTFAVSAPLRLVYTYGLYSKTHNPTPTHPFELQFCNT
ncbi:hypothetical protein ACJQWK_03346 [Exserohilum turcicum]